MLGRSLAQRAEHREQSWLGPPSVGEWRNFVTVAGSVLDIPVTLNIKIDELAVKLQPGSIKLDVLR